MTDHGSDDLFDGPLLLPTRSVDDVLSDRVRTAAHARIAAARRPVHALRYRPIDLVLSAAVAGVGTAYIHWALTFTSGLYR